jgi:hypothetical protein
MRICFSAGQHAQEEEKNSIELVHFSEGSDHAALSSRDPSRSPGGYYLIK